MENKWWEYYAVRYFVGTVFGAVIIAYLYSDSGNPIRESLKNFGEFKDSTFLGVSLTAALGFAYCYIASAPILTYHATRMYLHISKIKNYELSDYLSALLSIFIVTALSCLYLPLSAAFMIGSVVGGQIALLTIAFLDKFKSIEYYYRKLAINRSEANIKKDEAATAGLEFVTSYRHLREHGNAMAIIIFELILAYILFHTTSASNALYLILFWIFPATSTWILGTILESRFVLDPVKNKK